MKYINLIDQLSELDKIRLENYIDSYGAIRENFIGVDAWLQAWSHSKQKLYRLMGQQLIQEYDYMYEKSADDMMREVRDKLMDSSFRRSYHKFYIELIRPWYQEGKIDDETRHAFSDLTDEENFINDRVWHGFKFKRENIKRTLQIQQGMKPIRALAKVIDYFKDIWEFHDFEEFRLAHSMILNDKLVKGKFCISIHPLDFITMSDNASNWQSCMSWVDDGCYHQGTVEMMNSNNVMVCYLKNTKEPFKFGRKSRREDTPAWEWNNKRWRVLGYVTKDIIMSGKPYPYKNEDMCKAVIEKLKYLAKENLGWTYSFGPERYQDMIHISSTGAMENNRTWIRTKHTTKHNIIWDTNGMYNDMLNDHYTPYWCYRNKVDHNKIINVSGKSVCLCCGGSVISRRDPEWDDDYNDRFNNHGDGVCNDCWGKNQCDECGEGGPWLHTYQVTAGGHRMNVCENCYDTFVKKCPCCRKPFYINTNDYIGWVPPRNPDSESRFFTRTAGNDCEDSETNAIEAVYVCQSCLPQMRGRFEQLSYKVGYWNNYRDTFTMMKPDTDLDHFRFSHYEPVEGHPVEVNISSRRPRIEFLVEGVEIENLF